MVTLFLLQVNLAYENVKEVDGLDITKEGTEMWEAALKRYDERIDRVEVSEKQSMFNKLLNSFDS